MKKIKRIVIASIATFILVFLNVVMVNAEEISEEYDNTEKYEDVSDNYINLPEYDETLS